MDENSKNQLLDSLYEIDVIKFGQFVLKSGDISPIYIDMREIVSHPKILKYLSEILAPLVKSVVSDNLCGVPYGALAMASVVSVLADKPMLLYRQQTKEHGTKKRLDGKYKQGDTCVIIEDVATTGSSIIETVKVLREHGLVVKDAIVVMDREQGARNNLTQAGINLISVLKLSDLMNRLPADLDQSVRSALEVYFSSRSSPVKKCQPCSWQLEDRIACVHHPVAKRLLGIMLKKKSNLCVAADLTSTAGILQLARDIGSKICSLKLHTDIIGDFTMDFANELKKLSSQDELDFVIIEDRKFGDTGNTVALQTGGIHQLVSWVDAFTVHGVPGPGVLKGLQTTCMANSIGCFLVAQMSSDGNLIDEHYQKGVLRMASEFPDLVAGFICQKRFVEDNKFLFLSPGVNVGVTGDGLYQQWRSPEDAIGRDGVDIVIVGRGVINDNSPKDAAETYRQASWNALSDRK